LCGGGCRHGGNATLDHQVVFGAQKQQVLNPVAAHQNKASPRIHRCKFNKRQAALPAIPADQAGHQAHPADQGGYGTDHGHDQEQGRSKFEKNCLVHAANLRPAYPGHRNNRPAYLT
jgi:hypothetical protein